MLRSGREAVSSRRLRRLILGGRVMGGIRIRFGMMILLLLRLVLDAPRLHEDGGKEANQDGYKKRIVHTNQKSSGPEGKADSQP